MTDKEIYDAAIADGGATPVSDLAAAAGVRPPAYITRVLAHAQTTGSKVPEFCLHRKKPNAIALVAERSSGQHDLRVSATALAFHGAGNVTCFDIERGEAGAVVLRPSILLRPGAEVPD